MKNKRGITLVSLVVTIIVLIILAGVSINLTLGENGIITVAKKARENMEIATIEEQTKLNALYTQIELEDENVGGIDNNSISKLIEFKQKVAAAITDMGIETLETANADTMASNIRNIVTNKDASSISYDNTNSELSATNVQGAVDELNDSLEETNSNLTPKKFTPSYTNYTGANPMTKIEAVKSGNVITMRVDVNITNATVNSGENFCQFFIDEDIRPLIPTNGLGIRDGRVVGLGIETNGRVTLRNTSSASYGIGDGAYASVTYICE